MLSKLSKTAYLDTKWDNCDINVVEQANIPHFNKLDDIGTPFRLLKLFFVDVLVVWLLVKPSCTIIERKQTLVLKISNEIFCLFFGMLLLCGCHKLPERRIYWETSPDTFVKVMSDYSSKSPSLWQRTTW